MSLSTRSIFKEKTKIKVKKPKDYKVIMFNDDYTTMEFVIEILINVFDKNYIEAEKIMLDVHQKGRGVAGIYSYDIAITKARHAMTKARQENFPFRLTVEEV